MTSSTTPSEHDAVLVGRQLAALLVAGLAVGEPRGGAMIEEARRLNAAGDPRTAAGFYEHIERCLRAACRVVDVDAYLTLIDDAHREHEGPEAARAGRGLATGVVRALSSQDRGDGALHRIAQSMLSHDSDATRDAFFAQLERLLWVAARFAGADAIDPGSAREQAPGDAAATPAANRLH
ncbi:MAG: hypothetical protein QM674_10970 [Burkholderiaceae bacterium]